tara:strand:+ start:14824 stop:15504 length:681 start_codon:yes stop_codon:yes gene_type:complete
MNTKKGKIILPATDPSSIDVNKLKPGQVVLFGDSTKEGSISMKRKDGRINDLTELGSSDGSSSGSVSYPENALLAGFVRDIEDRLQFDVFPPSTGYVKNIAPFVIINKQLECNTVLLDAWNGYDANTYANEVINASLQEPWLQQLEKLRSNLNDASTHMVQAEHEMKKMHAACVHSEDSTGSDLNVLLNELTLSRIAVSVAIADLERIEQKLSEIIQKIEASINIA